MDNNQKANLGCGTLILIALIVLLFGNAGSDDLKNEIQQLRREVSMLERKIDYQTVKIEEIRRSAEQQ